MPKLKLPLLLLFTAFIISCSKDSNVNPYKAIFQYKVNGNLITIHNISIAAGESATFMKRWQGNGSPPSRYSFNGQKGVDNTWYFSILSDSLQVRNYTYDSTYQYTPFMNYNGQPSGLYFNGDYMKINITSYANGYISGDFTAKLTPIKEPGGSSADYSKKGTTLITEGLFKNIPCSY